MLANLEKLGEGVVTDLNFINNGVIIDSTTNLGSALKIVAYVFFNKSVMLGDTNYTRQSTIAQSIISWKNCGLKKQMFVPLE